MAFAPHNQALCDCKSIANLRFSARGFLRCDMETCLTVKPQNRADQYAIATSATRQAGATVKPRWRIFRIGNGALRVIRNSRVVVDRALRGAISPDWRAHGAKPCAANQDYDKKALSYICCGLKTYASAMLDATCKKRARGPMTVYGILYTIAPYRTRVLIRPWKHA